MHAPEHDTATLRTALPEEGGLVFSGRTVVVTGGGRGIGAETARSFSARGANLVIADIDMASAQGVADSLPRALVVRTDVTSRESLRAMFDEATARFGGVDVLINNAASCSDVPFLEITEEVVRRDVEVSMLGPFFASQEVIPGMIERGGGVILNVSSVNALAYFGCEAYSAAKAGLTSLTKSIAIRFGKDGIRCNAIAPGSVATEAWDRRKELDPLVFEKAAQWYPLGRIGTPSDIANALMFLASDSAAWITGVVLPVDGGVMTGNLELVRAIIPPAV
jgi:meso-butanediol dehydrogenase/(S,S)-butanediol dehydrogenase/diacetyl reductase